MITLHVVAILPGEKEPSRYRQHVDEKTPFDEVLDRARTLAMRDGASSVTIESNQARLTLIHHNDFGGHLLIGSPKPNKRNWGRTWMAPDEKRFGNNVRVCARWHPEEGTFAAYAIFNKKVLNRLDADDETDLMEKFKFLCSSWKHASPGNLKDEAQDAPDWVEA